MSEISASNCCRGRIRCQRVSAQAAGAVQSRARRSSIAAVGMSHGMVSGQMGSATRMQSEVPSGVGVAGGNVVLGAQRAGDLRDCK